MNASKFIVKNTVKLVYPSMWSRHKLDLKHDTLYIPDRIATNGLPLAFGLIKEFFN